MGLVFFIHSASLCLLVGAFNPFTFKVIIDIYVPIQRRKWQPTPVLLPGKYHGWRSLVGYSPWGLKESDRTERLHFLSFSSSFWRRKWQPTPVFLPGESHGWRGLVGCSLWGCKQSDMTKQLSLTLPSEANLKPIDRILIKAVNHCNLWLNLYPIMLGLSI